jgi:hypothetical protein
MSRDACPWVGIVAAVVAFDIVCDRRGWPTLSSTTRAVMRTDTESGGVLFVAGWSALTYWFVPHIVRRDHRRNTYAFGVK